MIIIFSQESYEGKFSNTKLISKTSKFSQKILRTAQILLN